jgi:hypothetical protein
MVIGGVLGSVLGLVGPLLYTLAVVGFLLVAHSLGSGETDFGGFWGVVFLTLMALGVTIMELPAVVAISGINGAFAGLIGSVLANRPGRSLIITATACGATALIPVTICLCRPLSPYVSTNLIMFYIPSALYVSAMGLLGTGVCRYLVVRHFLPPEPPPDVQLLER